jgi:hypothetical protein
MGNTLAGVLSLPRLGFDLIGWLYERTSIIVTGAPSSQPETPVGA